MACGIREDGAMYCWGHGGREGLGLLQGDEYGASTSPSRVATNTGYIAVSAGRTHVCAVAAANSRVECWGDNYYGESGAGDQSKRARTPTAVGAFSFTATAVGTGHHSCALTPAGAAYCWGLNKDGRLGVGPGSPEPCGISGDEGCSSLPVAVKGGLAFRSLSAGLEFTCGITTGGDAYCWGDNMRGQLGTGDRTPAAAPVKVLAP
jgi:alpha-tubulin suppressor-like RCC1 family protein